MNDPTPHGNDLTVYDLLRTADGPELTVSVSNPEEFSD